MKRWLLVAALVCAAALQPVQASTFIAMSTTDLVREASTVVEGEVLKVESIWDSQGRIIVTEALVHVDEVILGDAPAVVRVKTFGGTVSGYTIEAHGFPVFAKGERLVLFLHEDSEPDVMRVTGYQQGQYRIRPDAAGADKAYSAVDGEARLIAPNGRAVQLPNALPLSDLKQLIRNEADRLADSPVVR